MSDALTLILGGLLGFALIGLIALPRYIGARRLAAATATPFHTIADGARWLPCHTTNCGHMTTRHDPTPDGAWQCTGPGCGNITKGEQ